MRLRSDAMYTSSRCVSSGSPGQSAPFNDLVSSTDRRTIEFPAGHIGLAVGSKAQTELWPQVCEWLAARSDAQNYGKLLRELGRSAESEHELRIALAQSDDDDAQTRVSLARYIDGGRTFTNYAWNAVPFAADSVFLGDYEWLVAQGGRVFGTWAEPVPPGYVLAVPPAPSTVSVRTPTVIRVGSADFRQR